MKSLSSREQGDGARHKEEADAGGKSTKQRDYSLCRSSCSVCPYHRGLLKLLDHGNTIVPTLPEADE